MTQRLLILLPQLPWPAHQGTTLRNLNIIRGLAEHVSITLLCYVENEDVEFGPLEELCDEIVTVIAPQRSIGKRVWQLVSSPLPDMAHRLDSFAFDLALDGLLSEQTFDVVQIEGIELARAIEQIREENPDQRIVFDNHNAETELQRVAFETDVRNPRRWIAAAYSWLQVRRLGNFERWALETANATVAVSTDDAQLLAALAPNAVIDAIPNCIDTSAYASFDGEPIPFDLMFMGKMDYRPNIDAVLWFIDEIWPKVRTQRHDATFAIVGQKPHARLDRIRDLSGVTVTGWVDSVMPYIAGAGVVVMPLRVGSGTRLKLIQTLSAARPTVSTTIGVAGFPVADGEEVLIADDSAEFAAAILRLLDDPILGHELGQKGRTFTKQYDFRAVVPRFLKHYQGS